MRKAPGKARLEQRWCRRMIVTVKFKGRDGYGVLAEVPRLFAPDGPGAAWRFTRVKHLAHNKNVNLILSSHLLPDVEHVCDDVVVMDKGRIAAAGRAGAEE